ncbi:DUF4307 domain-containing protein [Corynebacterium breve]|uniref:DUF4307 domain-containing protein n=1 Tax=Corynebacterium breve TaxID=3049799 RepID=A0ABY8VHR3_9CORY|nr:DUF4307 domain-containing protein [Corynebacterium breve]WIM68496.1 DUF4307 domain-containing protein [Corynebacterium breve]
MTTPNQARPADRYGKQKDPKKPQGIAGKVVAIVLVLVFAAILIMAARLLYSKDASPVSASFITHERLDDTTSRVWIDVVREDTSKPTYCIVTALNYGMAEVGRREVILPAGGEEQVRMSVDLPVREYPVSGKVYGCAEDIPFYMNVDDPTYTLD